MFHPAITVEARSDLISNQYFIEFNSNEDAQVLEQQAPKEVIFLLKRMLEKLEEELLMLEVSEESND